MAYDSAVMLLCNSAEVYLILWLFGCVSALWVGSVPDRQQVEDESVLVGRAAPASV